MKNRKITLPYIFFYILFFPDTYRILIGLLMAWLFAPFVIASKPMPHSGEFVVWIMVATIGYAVSARIGNLIADRLKDIVLPHRKDQ